MILIFAFSVTPKIVLHNLIASHHDSSSYKFNGGTVQVSKTGFQCDCESPVVASPFTEAAIHVEFLTAKVFPFFKEEITYFFHGEHRPYTSFRGPPSVYLS